ncbi:MAG: PilZ domain-containing protein [Thermodesulfovibrionales bacterium]|nr:PilZ domain-containing protein [Thermodesulfovibrionales bacterium]
MLDISRGGLCFLTDCRIPFATKVVLEVSVVPDDDPLTLKGRVSWVSRSLNRSYKYTIGIEFNVYGNGKRFNSMDNLTRLLKLEEQFSENKIDV